MKRYLSTVCAFLALFAVIGCANVWYANKATFDTAKGAMSGWADYYVHETNGAAPVRLIELNAQKQAVDDTWRKYVVSVKLVNDINNAGLDTNSVSGTNSSDNRIQWSAAVQASAANSSNVIWLIKSFVNKKK